jgi:hypothetical protein
VLHVSYKTVANTCTSTRTGDANFTIQRLILIKATPVIHSVIGSKDFIANPCPGGPL